MSKHLHRLVPASAAVFALLAGCINKSSERIAATTADGRLVSIDSVTTSYDASGVHVIQRRNVANPVVAVDVYLLGGLREVTRATQGIEMLALTVSQYGTRGYPGGAARAALGRTGSRIVVEPAEDWTRFGFRGINSEFDSTWNVFADRLMNPSLGSRDIEATRARLIGNIRQRFNSPDGAISAIADSVAFEGHPYALSPYGSELSLASLDSAAVSRFVAERAVRSRMLVVVVGNVERATVERAIARTFARLPMGAFQWTLPRPALMDGGRVLLVQRPMASGYLLGLYQGPEASSGDYAAFRVAVSMLGSLVNQSVREERGLSYAAYAPFYDRGVGAGGLYASTANPIETLDEMTRQVHFMWNFPTDYPTYRFVSQFVSEYLAANSTSAAQAAALARAQLYRGDYRLATKEMDDLRRVSAGSIAMVSQRYFKQMRFVYLGDTAKLGRELRRSMAAVTAR